MNPKCHKCKKATTEDDKLSFLDKFWHKQCFKCEACGKILDLETYRGYKKLPYCEDHYPTTKFIAVSDTPENRRLQQQAKQAADVHYTGNVDGRFKVVSDEEAAKKKLSLVLKPKPKPKTKKGQQQEPVKPPQPGPQAKAQSPHVKYKAMYDYNAADEDEVSFVEGDIIIDAKMIDDGWMEGQIARTNQFGMIPSNYAEKCN